jgi:hypothetical protein
VILNWIGILVVKEWIPCKILSVTLSQLAQVGMVTYWAVKVEHWRRSCDCHPWLILSRTRTDPFPDTNWSFPVRGLILSRTQTDPFPDADWSFPGRELILSRTRTDPFPDADWSFPGRGLILSRTRTLSYELFVKLGLFLQNVKDFFSKM